MEDNKEEKIIESTQGEQVKAVLSVEEEQIANNVGEQEVDKELGEKKDKKQKFTFWKIIGQIITGKYNPDEEENAFTMATLTSLIVNGLAIVLLFGSLAVVGVSIIELVKSPWTQDVILTNIAAVIMTIVVLVIGLFLPLLLRVLALGVQKEKDKHYVLAMFSGMTGFVALIISLVALFK